ncbi:MAG: glycine zipper 2TM domain-containing protein [Gammaproteobacteria bacterium]|nr:MAG: glycine zipper 2TM domain-containing protein [Gammaproteobacteria bacterium]
MKYATLKILAIFSAIVIVSPARADYQESSDTYFDQAKVLSAVPVYRTVRVSTPRRECRQVPVTYSDRGHGSKSYKSATPIVLGSIVGAAIGNQFGHGTGKTVGTIAGGILGGSVARDAQSRYGNQSRGHDYGYGHSSSRTTTRCDTYEDYRNEERIDGYSVKYRYNGRVYQTRTDTDPGKRMQVKVSVVPAEY